jgi:CDP-glycerol glycerophosphotransferase (TagB/SpsB family)
MDNIKLAANLLYHSALVIVTVSTMGLDACSYNKPVITIGFDLHKRPIYQSALRYYKFFDHQRYWLDTGAYKLVQSKEELISQINTYLKHPETDNDARQKLIDKIFYKFDGRVGERMANIIMDNAKK